MALLDPVVLLVLAAQLGIFRRCSILARADESEELDHLRNTFEQDIRIRAKRGDGADWVRYMDEADRVHERRVDRMRVWATAALVVGIGGTMLALAVRLWGLSTFELEVLTAFAPALGASLIGVGNNLLITLLLFRLSDHHFDQALKDFRKALDICSEENAPQERFADAVRDQLGEAFREAVRSFPEAFAQLDRSVQHMSESAAAQSQSMVEAASGLQKGVDGLTAAAVQLAPVAELLNTATTELRAVPGQLRQTLDETREAWAQEMRRDQEAFLGSIGQVLDDQREMLARIRQALQRWERGRRDAAEQQQATWRETVDLVQKAAREIVGTAEGLPAAFTRGVEQVSDGLGREFSLGARQHVADLTQEIREGNRTLREQIEASSRELQNRLLNDTHRVVGKSAEEVHRRVGEPLLSMLQGVSRGIEEALRTLPGNAETFAASLSTADEKLQQSIERLKESADHLERVVDLSENFRASLAGAFRDGAAESFEPVRKDLQDIASELRRAAARAERAGFGAVTGFFRRLLSRLRRRGTGDDPPGDGKLRLR